MVDRGRIRMFHHHCISFEYKANEERDDWYNALTIYNALWYCIP